MTPTLIVLGLLAIGAAIVVLATRQRDAAPAPVDPETGWSDPVPPGGVPTGDDAFAHAPEAGTGSADPARTTEPQT